MGITRDVNREHDDQVMRAILDRVAAHDSAYGKDWDTDRDGVRLGVAAVQDETKELYDEWDAEKRTLQWDGATFETLDVAATAFRLLRSLLPDQDRRHRPLD